VILILVLAGVDHVISGLVLGIGAVGYRAYAATVIAISH
jgi:hypothetical protein